jgi:hypothetical protein
VTYSSSMGNLIAGQSVDKIILSASEYSQLSVSLMPNIERSSYLGEILGH